MDKTILKQALKSVKAAESDIKYAIVFPLRMNRSRRLVQKAMIQLTNALELLSTFKGKPPNS